MRAETTSWAKTKISQATPRPWRAALNSAFWEIQRQEGAVIADTCASSCDPENGLTLELGEANAALIVKCVNAHDALVAALKRELSQGHGTPADELVEIRKQSLAALALAGL